MTISTPLDMEKRGFSGSSPTAKVRSRFAKSCALVVRLIGPPGAGKTQLIQATLDRLPSPQRVAVIAVNPAASRDAQRLRGQCGYVASIDEAVPHPREIWRAATCLEPDLWNFILIEAAGGLGTLPDLGQDVTVAVFAVSGGDDKAAEYSSLLQVASAVVLTKSDLRPLVKFDMELFRADVERVNPQAQLHEVSSMTGSGMHSWLDWLHKNRMEKVHRGALREPAVEYHENFLG